MSTARLPHETREEFAQRWKDEQPARLAARRAARSERGRSTRLLLRVGDLAAAVGALALVAAVAVAAVAALAWTAASTVGPAWPWLSAAVVVFALGLAVAWARR